MKHLDPNYNHKSRKVTEEMAKQMVKLRENGESLSEIARKFNVTPPTVKYNTDEEYRIFEIERTANR